MSRVRTVLILLFLPLGLFSGVESRQPDRFELLDGDRVVFIGNTLLERERQGGYIETALTVRYPGRKVTFRNLSWPGDTVDIQLRPLNFGDLRTHLEDYRPTVAILSYGMYEALEGPERLGEFLEGYRRTLDILDELEVREVALLGPIPHEAKGAPFPDPTEHNRNLALYSSAIRDLSRDQGDFFIDLFGAFGGGNPQPIPYTDNGVHLNDYGYRLAAREIDRRLHQDREPWRVAIEAGEGILEKPQGVSVEQNESAPNSVSFTGTSTSLPPPPIGEVETPGGGVHLGTGADSDRQLIIRRLGPGNYDLSIGGRSAASGDAKDWETGMTWTQGPEYQQLEELRQAIVRKNRYFFYRWRAHNGEYIYGRRAKSSGDGYGQGNSGNEQFPAEMAEFERLIAEEEARIIELAKPQPARYEVRKIKAAN